MDRATALKKIKKCLALAKSSNEHEAAAALRQAQKLMAEYNVGERDVLASEAGEAEAKAGAKSTPARWESRLANTVARAFGCELIFVGRWKAGAWSFIGCGAQPEVAAYAFTVLLRQAKSARTAYSQSALKRCKPATRVRRADLFCDAWVMAVRKLVGDFAAGDERQHAAIAAYKAKLYPDLAQLKPRDRNEDGPKREHEYRDLQAGREAGRNAQLHHGVGGSSQLAVTDAH